MVTLYDIKQAIEIVVIESVVSSRVYESIDAWCNEEKGKYKRRDKWRKRRSLESFEKLEWVHKN